jgi:predicted O-methyltransferase YrrM
MPVKSVMDTGSGFSSFVMRREAISKGGIHHVALEDNEFWLGKTREFLTAEGVPNDNVLSWNDYQKSPGKFDLIFHDLGNPTTRILSLPTIRDSVTPGGLLLLDDMHKQHYAPHVPNILGDGWALESLLGLTLDSLGRFAYAARPK